MQRVKLIIFLFILDFDICYKTIRLTDWSDSQTDQIHRQQSYLIYAPVLE